MAPPKAGDTQPGLQPGGAPVDLEREVDPDALLASLASRPLPEVTSTSGESAAVFASADATPAHRHHTPVPQPAVIAPDPRREPTRRIPREWTEPLDATAKSAMAQGARESRLRWAAFGLFVAAMIVAAILLAQHLWPSSVNVLDPAGTSPARGPTPDSTQASSTQASVRSTVAPAEPSGDESKAAPSRPRAPPAPRARPSRSNEKSPQDDPDYKLLK